MYFLRNQQYNQHDFHILFPKMFPFHVSSFMVKCQPPTQKKNMIAEQPAFIKGKMNTRFHSKLCLKTQTLRAI